MIFFYKILLNFWENGDFARVWQRGRVVYGKFFSVGLGDDVRNAWRSGDKVEIELSFKAFFDDLHVQKPQESVSGI